MNDLRSMIIERVKTHGPSGFWILDTYHHLISNGVPADDAITAMNLFVDEVIERKRERCQRPSLKAVE